MNSAPTQSYSVTDMTTPHVADNFNFKLDAEWLRKTLWDFQQGYCSYCAKETRIGGNAGNDYAVLNNIGSHPARIINTAANLALCCTECATEKADHLVEVFIYGKLRKLSPQQRSLVVSTHKQLRSYYDQFRNNNNKNANDYYPLDLESFVQSENRKQQASAPATVATTPAPAQQPSPEEEHPKTEEEHHETEAETCMRWTKEIQSNIPTAHLGAVQNILNIIERVGGLHDNDIKEQFLGNVYDSLCAAVMLDNMVGEVPQALAYMSNYDDGSWITPDHLEKYLPSEGVDMEKQMLRVQKCMAMLDTDERAKAYEILKCLTGKWNLQSALYVALNAANTVAIQAFKLNVAYANHPKLKRLGY